MLCDAINWHFGTLRIHFVVLNMEHIDKNCQEANWPTRRPTFLLNINTWMPKLWFALSRPTTSNLITLRKNEIKQFRLANFQSSKDGMVTKMVQKVSFLRDWDESAIPQKLLRGIFLRSNHVLKLDFSKFSCRSNVPCNTINCSF